MKNIKKIKPCAFWVKRVLAVFFVILILGLVFDLGYASGLRGTNLGATLPVERLINKNNKTDGADFSLFWEAWDKLNSNFVGKLDANALIQGAISGMMEATKDPYTIYLKPEENKRFMDDISGEFDGIGVEISEIDGLPTVVAPLPDSPAERAKLKAKDAIYEVDGLSTRDMSFNEVINKIRGKEGTEVALTILRMGEKAPQKIVVTRSKITVSSVETAIKSYIGKDYYYIKLRQFGDDTSGLFAKAVDEIEDGDFSGIIIDLRNNPGGYLETSIDLASYFVDGGVVVSEVDRDGNKKESKTTRKATLKDKKVVLLINEGSASASEILAGALRDRKKAIIIGQKSYGKGSVQVLENLSNKGAVKITIAKWQTPNGSQIDGEGIEPDIKIENKDAGDEEYFNKAMEILAR